MKNLASLSILSFLAACGGGGGGETNPKILYLAPDNSELLVQLIATLPPLY